MDNETTAVEFDFRSFLYICSASLSILGSTTILFKIIRDRLKSGSMTPYDRFMVGVSCGDILISIYYAMSPFIYWNPSPASCQATGVLAILVLGSVWYNGLLSCYFLLTVLSQVRRKNLVERFEPWMHLSVISLLIIAILAYLGGWHSLDDSGTYCEPGPIHVIVGGIILVLAFLSMIVNYSVIYAVVRKTLRSPNESSETVDGSIPVRKQLFRESTNIMALYVGCYLVTWLPVIVSYILPILGVDLGSFLVKVFGTLSPMFTPLQGLFNAIIYLKPFYTRFRAANPNKSKWFVLHQAVVNSKAPRKNHRRIANHHTYHSDVLITDITLGEDGVVNPNELLFYPGQLSSSSDSSSNNIIAEEGEDNGAISDNVEESKEQE